MKLSKGQTVTVPTGHKATVKALGKIVTGKRGRPAHTAVVQLRGDRGHFVPGTVEYRARTLQPA